MVDKPRKSFLLILPKTADYSRTASLHDWCNEQDYDLFSFVPTRSDGIPLPDMEDLLSRTLPNVILNYGVPFSFSTLQPYLKEKGFPMIYLACPYWHEDSRVREARVLAATVAAAIITDNEQLVYSPITHGQEIHKASADAGLSPGDHSFWMKHAIEMLSNCSSLIVLCEEGWRESAGVQEEIAYAEDNGIPISYQALDNDSPERPRLVSVMPLKGELSERLVPRMATENPLMKGKDGSLKPNFPHISNGMSLGQLAAQVQRWQAYNFEQSEGQAAFKGLVEEFGELVEALLDNVSPLSDYSIQRVLKIQTALGRISHGLLKREQNIRGDQDHTADIRDAVGDLVIYLVDFCNQQKISFEDAVLETWDQVRQRDWIKFPTNGKDK